MVLVMPRAAPDPWAFWEDSGQSWTCQDEEKDSQGNIVGQSVRDTDSNGNVVTANYRVILLNVFLRDPFLTYLP